MVVGYDCLLCLLESPKTMKLHKEHRAIIGVIMLALAFILISTGGGVTWGVTGALWAAGITLAVYGVGFLASTSE
jgi:hypothetical protein